MREAFLIVATIQRRLRPRRMRLALTTEVLK